jgi:hypothetical protein
MISYDDALEATYQRVIAKEKETYDSICKDLEDPELRRQAGTVYDSGMFYVTAIKRVLEAVEEGMDIEQALLIPLVTVSLIYKAMEKYRNAH